MSSETDAKRSSRWTRRRFMQGAGVGALSVAGLTGTGARGEAEPDGSKGGGGPPRASTRYDAVVIGAGFAGATAARELRQRGLRVLVLEARSRVGGRTFTSDIEGHEVELGGAYFHWTQPHAWTEITRYGLEIQEPELAEPLRGAWLASGKLRELPREEFGLELFRGAGAFFYDARPVLERPYDPFFSRGIEKVDPLSVRDRLDAVGLPEEQKDLLDGLFSVSCHCDPSEAALVEMLRWYALSGWSIQDFADAAGRYTLRGGTRALIGRILEDAKAELRLSTPVRAVRQQGEEVVVTTHEGENIPARAVVVTLPLNVLEGVEFSPPLSAAKRAIAKEGHAGRGVKVHIKVRGQLGSFAGLAPWPSPLASLTTEYIEPDGTMLTAFGPGGELLDINDDAAIQEAVRRLIPDAEVMWAVGYDWNIDPYSRGTWCVLRPGQMTRYLRELQRPEGRLFYASADNANGWRGFIDGAIESGLRAGRQVAAMLA